MKCNVAQYLNRFRWLALVVIIVAAWFNFGAMVRYTIFMFSVPQEDLSHGWFIPFVSLFVLWRQRKAMRDAVGLPSWRGAMWVMLFLVIAWFGGRGEQTRIEQIAVIGLTWSVSYAFWGRGIERYMRFPAAYLFFTIPVSSYLAFFTIHLRILSSSVATGVLNGVGLMVERSGTALFSRVPGGEFNVDVADPCSGIRSLFAMMALTAAYAYFTQKTALRRWVLFACAVPIAMIGNMIRIISVCLMAIGFGQEAATGYYHDYSGYVIFLVGVLLMIQAGELLHKYGDLIERWLARLWRVRIIRAGSVVEEEKAINSYQAYGPVGLVFVLTLLVFTANWLSPKPVYDQTPFVSSKLPNQVGEFIGTVPWFCHNPQCLEICEESDFKNAEQKTTDGFRCPACKGLMYLNSLGESTGLPNDTTLVKLNYRAPDGLKYAVSVVIGGKSRKSIHRAEICLPAQGFLMVDVERKQIPLAYRSPLAVREIIMQRANGDKSTLVYWFLSRERESCSHTERIGLDVWDRSVYNRINRWVMVAINVSSLLDTPESIERFNTFISSFYAQIQIKD